MTANPSRAEGEQADRAKRRRRSIARTVIVIDFLVLMGLLIALIDVDLNDHPGRVTAVFVAVAVFVIAFPFVGFRNASPGNREHVEREE